MWHAVPAVLVPIGGALTAQQSNVLILIADDFGVDQVGAYAARPNPPPTPNLDALAARGVLFRSAWANPYCSPTRACIQTGRYSFRTGVGRPIVYAAAKPQNTLLPIETALPEVLDAGGSGHGHAAIGKWHLDDALHGGAFGPNLTGWSHYAGMLPGWVDYFHWPRTVNGQTATSTTYATTQIVDDALAWIGAQTRPWVCHVAFNAPHEPWHVPPPHLHTQSLQGVPEGAVVPFYRAMVEAMDTEIGRLLAALGPQLARTHVIFIGDNGTPGVASEPPFRANHAKGTPYEGGLHVPLIVAGPAVAFPGREVDGLVGAVDVFATVAELCGVDPAIPFVRTDAVSLVPYLRDPRAEPQRATVFAEMFFGSATMTTGFAALRDPRHKLIRRFGAQPPREELYDLVTDPFEERDLLRGPMTPAQQVAYALLASELDRLRDPSGSFTRYGTAACAGSSGAPSIGGVGTPTAGAAYSVLLQNGARSRPAVLFIGASRTWWQGIALPFALTPLGGGTGCALYASGELLLHTATSAVGGVSVSIALPALPTLVAAPIHHAWLVLDPEAPANPLGLTTSDGAVAIVGS